MALEDLFVEEDVQDLEGRFDRIDQEFAISHKRRIIDWAEDVEDIFPDDN